ncbi:MAG: rhodanese-like domain-containing protein [Microbacteriaceae bacterium]|jgi:rhodanese-related sulfurtransferase|nr:rhodanese-like domain-containing protein [Microbacteriaceae bacterium]
MKKKLSVARSAAAVFGALALTVGLSACVSAAAAEPSVTVGPEAILLDVRTAAEFAEGHLEGATQLDFNGGDVAAAIPTLDPNAEYYVYCRSGNRSGQAIALMQQAGFTNLTNLGSVEQASSATGISIVR